MTNNKTKGFLLGAIAAASYGMNPLFTLPLYSAGTVSYTHLDVYKRQQTSRLQKLQ